MLKHGLDPQLATSYSPSEILSIGSAALALAASGVAAHLGLKNKALKNELTTSQQALYQAQQEHGKALIETGIDPLTKVLNRRGLVNYYDFLAGKNGHTLTRRSTDSPKESASVMLAIDLDDFKTVNGQNGHAGGDRSLRKVAKVLVNSVRTNEDDVVGVGRSGGDEFVIILPDTTGEEGLIVAERIKNKASMEREAVKEDGIIIPTLSIGVAAIDFSLSYDKTLEQADAALYDMKDSGKDGAALYLGEVS